MTLDPGVGRLTRREILKLQEVSDRHGSMDDWALAELTHGFGEWQKNKPAPHTARDIPVQDLLDAVGLAPCQQELADAEKLAKTADELFGEGKVVEKAPLSDELLARIRSSAAGADIPQQCYDVLRRQEFVP